MASQQAMQSIEQQDAISVSLVDPRGEASNRRNSAQPQPQPQPLLEIDQTLFNAYVMVDGARKALYEYRGALDNTTQVCSAWEQAYNEERQKRVACAGAYAELYGRLENTVDDLHAMSSKCLSLHRDLEHAQTDILSLQLTIQEQKRSLDAKDTSEAGEGCGASQLNWDMVQQGIKIEQLIVRIRELENEKSKMMREHKNALVDATNQICAKMRQTASSGKVRPSASRKVGKTCKNDNEAGLQQQGGRETRSRKAKELKLEPYSP